MEITVILPLNEINDETKVLLNSAVKSFEDAKRDGCKLMIVTTPEVKAELGMDKFEFVLTEAGGVEPTSFTHLVNKGVNACDTEYFSILEVDDTFSKNVFENARKYMESGYEASVYIPLTEAIDYNSGEVFGYINEGPLSSAFSEKINYLDLECVMDFRGINLTGAVFKKDDFVACGMLKESMKMYFWHEYLLRSINSGKQYFVVPKVGYKHMVNRPSSFFGSLSLNMGDEEAEWWFDLSKKEYLFKKDRNKTYEE